MVIWNDICQAWLDLDLVEAFIQSVVSKLDRSNFIRIIIVNQNIFLSFFGETYVFTLVVMH